MRPISLKMNNVLLAIAISTGLYSSGPFIAKGAMPDKFKTHQATQRQLSGQVFQGNKPLRGATVKLIELDLVAVTDKNGQFSFNQLPSGAYTLSVQYTGMKPQEMAIAANQSLVRVDMQENSIAIEDVQVVGQVSNVKGATSTYISRKAIEHLQATNLGELLQLLPGQVIANPSFQNVGVPNIRQVTDANGLNKASLGNVSSMGTAIIINGAQLSNNANLQSVNTARSGVLSTFSSAAGMGTDLRQLSADNVESVEVIRGIPSVEYGELTSGILDVKTKASVEPMQAKFRLNPTMRQAWVGQGFQVGKDAGALFVDVDYTHASDNQIKTSEVYQRINTSMQYTNTFGRNKSLYTNSSLSFGGYFDNSRLDPDLATLNTVNRAENYDFRFSTNGRWNLNKRFARNINYVLSGQYGSQNGFQQSQTTGNVSVISNNLENSTIEVPYLPSSYLQQLWIKGKPLSIQAKLSDNFYFTSGGVKHGVVIGGQYSLDKNFGAGKYYDPAFPPKSNSNIGFRPRAFSDIPALQQLSFYAEDKLSAFILNRELSIVAGVRYDQVQPFRSDAKSAFSPRVNASYNLFEGLKIRGGYGHSVKAPSLVYLYPDNAYVDVFSLNHYKDNPAERLAMMTTRVFSTENSDLKMAKSKKAELGLDYRFLKNKRVSLTYYNEQTKNGYAMYQYYNFANIPMYSVQSQATGEKPVLSPVVKDSLYVVDYSRPTNNANITNKGFEFDVDFGRIDAIRTSFTVNGAYLSTKQLDNSPFVYARRVANEPYTKLGVFEGRGHTYERFVSTIRAIHHIPELRLIVSVTAQTIWKDKDKYLGYSSRPYGVINIAEGGAGAIDYLTAAQIAAIPETSSLYLNVDDGYYRENSWKPTWLFNMKLTKEFGKNYGFSFYANNVTNNRPLRAGTRNPTQYEKRNLPIFFGSELTFKF